MTSNPPELTNVPAVNADTYIKAILNPYPMGGFAASLFVLILAMGVIPLSGRKVSPQS